MGFIGSALIRKLLKDKNNTVINIDKLTYASNQDSIGNTKDKNYVFFQEDIINSKKIDNIIQHYKPNFIIHLAAESHVDRSIELSKFHLNKCFGNISFIRYFT